MNVTALNNEQRILAIHRLTALWAFAESGLGGFLHAVKIPFTGLVVGGFAIIVITLIAQLSNKHYKHILQSLVIVLMVKAAVSPHTPFPAYIAVSFQALLAVGLFTLLRVNLFSILLFAIIAMLESAVQKLLILTLFFGKSLWRATDEVVAYIAKQFSLNATHGSNGLIAIYLGIYLAGGIFIGLISYRLIRKLSSGNIITLPSILNNTTCLQASRKNKPNKIFSILFVALALSGIIFLIDDKLTPALKTLVWTFTVIIAWYLLIGPLLLRIVKKSLQSYHSEYSQQLSETLSFLPVASQLAMHAWKESSAKKVLHRIPFFIYTLISCSLIYQQKDNTGSR